MLKEQGGTSTRQIKEITTLNDGSEPFVCLVLGHPLLSSMAGFFTA